MEKSLSFRLEKTTVAGAINQLNHDRRIVIPKYVDKSKLQDNKTIYENDDLRAYKTLKAYNEGQISRVKEKTGRKAQKSAEFFNKGIMTFSDGVNEDYERDPILFEECIKTYIQALEDELGLQVVYAELHRDERLNHIHLLFDNIDKTTGKGIRRKINPQQLSKAQDLMGKAFKPFNYKRGQPKSETNAKHLGVKTLHQIGEIANSLKEENIKMEQLIKLKQENNKDLDMLLRMLKNNGTIDFKTEKGKQAKKNITDMLN